MSKPLFHIFPFIILMVLPAIGISQMYNTQVEAKIDMQQYGNSYSITGSASNKTVLNQSLIYKLSVIKNGGNDTNISNNDQSGRFVLEPGEKKNLSNTTIIVSEEDRVVVLLLINDEEDKPLGMDRIVINGNENDLALEKRDSIEREKAINPSPDVNNQNQDGFLLRGVVVEDTKTKPGRDFYKMFYSLYSSNNINGEEIVTIKEELSLNNNTKIELLVANEKVMEFFLRPQNDYLKAMAETSIKRVYWFLRTYKERKKTQKYY